MDDLVRHARLHPSDVRKFRAMGAAESMALAAGITDALIALARARGARRPRFWRPEHSTMS